MPATSGPRGTGGTPDTPAGIATGLLLRQIRDQIGFTQETLAERLGVELGTYKSWETGRRPLGQVKVTTLRHVLRVLRGLGCDHRLLDRFHTAVDVDQFISDALKGTDTDIDHQLATWVSTREWNDMLGQALTTKPNGIVPYPRLPPAERARFYDSLRSTAERARDTSAAGVLLRRQLYFLAARDDTTTGRDWLAAAERRELRGMRRVDGWTPTWVAGRSLAVARACQGDYEPLREFIAHRIADDDLCEAANLNYWAYWIGEASTSATSDEFMAEDLGQWRGAALLSHLTDGLRSETPYLDLSVHTLWALLERRPYLLNDDPAVARRLQRRIRALLDTPPSHLGQRARRELDQLHYATRMTARGPR